MKFRYILHFLLIWIGCLLILEFEAKIMDTLGLFFIMFSRLAYINKLLD